MDSRYRTIASESPGLYKEKGSKFLAYAIPVDSVEQVQEQLATLKSKHQKARHLCYAYILGANGLEYRSFDDGEPKHSAGDPILGQLRSFELTNILVAVVRYFGGTKLGISGLINAYREAARQAIESAAIIEKEPVEVWSLTFSYPEINQVMKLVKELDLIIIEQDFAEQCKLSLRIPVSKQEQMKNRIAVLSKVVCEINV